MPRSSVSLESLSSPSPSPPPPKQRALPPPQNNDDPPGLDSDSELSELTEDEQDSTKSKSKSSIRKQPTRRTRRSLIPDQMWGWYKKKSLSEEKSKDSEPPDSSTYSDHGNGVGRQSIIIDIDDDPEDAPDSLQGCHDQPQPPPANSTNKPSNDSDSEPTGGEQDSAETKSKTSIHKQPTRRTRRSRIPDQMWGWYKKKSLSEEKINHSEPPIMAANTILETPSPPSSVSAPRSPSPAPTKVEETKGILSEKTNKNANRRMKRAAEEEAPTRAAPSRATKKPRMSAVRNTDRSPRPPLSRDDTRTRNEDLTPAVGSALDLPLLANVDEPAWKRLASRAFLPHGVVSLIETILMSEDEVKMIGNLSGDDAQNFVDVIHEALDHPNLKPQLRRMCLRVLCRICGRQALLPKSLQIPLCYNRLDTPLYRGGYADVWKGEHQGCHVAAKVLRIYSTSNIDKVTTRFCKEVVTWNALRHPNVLPLLGVTMSNSQFAMVSEWMGNGNINEFVKAHRDANRFELLRDIARGLVYMHGQAMVHGDLKGANILIDKDGHARLADFGLLTIVSDPINFTASSSLVVGGTTRWMSPELLHPDQFGLEDSRPTNESDCYALGMVIYEVLSGQAPFTPLKDFVVMRKVTEGERPARPEGAKGVWFTDYLWGMMGMCWATRPESRPKIATVLERLEQVSTTWEPLSPQMEENVVQMDEDDWHFTLTKLEPISKTLKFGGDRPGFHITFLDDRKDSWD